MCNLYAIRKARAEAARLARAMVHAGHNQPPMSGVYPDYPAPIVRMGPDGQREIVDARWGLPTPPEHLEGKNYDKGVTNVRRTFLDHWRRWLAPENRCLVPFTAFAEPNDANRSENVWFAFGEDRPMSYFAGVWTHFSGVRKVKEGAVTCEVFGFLTTTPNADIGAVHKKAMPVILSSEDDQALWLSDRPWAEVKHLQRPLPDGSLVIVRRGVGSKMDEDEPVAVPIQKTDSQPTLF
jgi:putative SOS response-associated peptidase YedK